jgi:predicted short-subunit dehydrogenase-like oxidoreductase (DUF2520 family)
MKVTIIGSGNVATVLAKKMKQSGCQILQVWSRMKENANKLADVLSASPTNKLLDINGEADIYMIAVNDTHISRVASKLRVNNKVVVHTAGGISKEILRGVSLNYGVIYPLQTLRKETSYSPEVPILVDGNNKEVIDLLINFSLQWTGNVDVADDNKRLKLHVSAVIAGNFTNYLFSVAEQYCQRENLDFKLLYPLIEETCNRIKYNSPAEVQTGPAIRRDIETINRHLECLLQYPQIQGLYKILSSSIMNRRI